MNSFKSGIGYLFNATSKRDDPTMSPGTGSAINSTHEACRACDAAFGNSLKRQSRCGNGGGCLLLIANISVKDDNFIH